MGESRTELLSWVNDLLQLEPPITKIEQFGTGAPLCQIYDSIYGDVQMSKVKFNVITEYGYLENFRILQTTFKKHNIERSIPVTQLVKCKMQDNLDFLQFTKKYWDQYYSGEAYDALARRKGLAGPVSAAPRQTTAPVKRTTPANTQSTSLGIRPRVGAGLTSSSGGSSAALTKLQAENTALTETVTGLERERDFYFSKLRDIELLVQGAFEAEPALEQDEGGLLKQIQNILYSTEEGFEIPAETEEGHQEDHLADEHDQNGVAAHAEEETF